MTPTSSPTSRTRRADVRFPFSGDPEAYSEHLSALVQLEREEEMEAHEREIRSLSGAERQARGRAVLNLRGRGQGEALEGHLVKFLGRPGEELPETEILVGDLVMVSRGEPLRGDNPTGTVTEKTGYSLTVAFDGRPPSFVTGKGLRVDLYVNDITYQRMLEALGRLRTAGGRLGALRDVLVGAAEPAEPEAVDPDWWYDPALNDSQRRAVVRALGADDLFLVHGPPGTGKTTTVLEVIRQHAARGRSVLATAASNMAVDNVVEMLAERGVDVVRVGHPARVTPALRAHTLDALLRENETWRASRKLRDEAFARKDAQEGLTHPSGRHRRGMSNTQILELAERGRGNRGVPPHVVREMAEWIEIQEEADQLFERSRALEDAAIGEVLDAADVVCSTNSTAGSDFLADRTFDVVVIDEATQASEPSCLIPITRGRRVVLAGDHRQLPPTILSREAEEGGLARTLFERMAGAWEERLVEMLEVQYRMHEGIMAFPGREFYDGRLEAHGSVRTHTLRDLGFDEGIVDPDLRPAVLPEEPVVFVDTSGLEAPERQRTDSSSRENPREAELVARLAGAFLRGGVADHDLAVIAPYKDQVDRLRGLIPESADDLQVRTVDGFQGREKEVVILSLVRSNEKDEIGFLKDLRRLNVAITRPRRKLVVVGDASTVATHPVYERFVGYAEEEGTVVRP